MYYLYRKNGGEVLGVSTEDVWTDSTYIGVFSTGAVLPLDPPLWCDGAEVREATAPEIADFAANEAEDTVAEKQALAKDVVDGTAAYKQEISRVLRALVELILEEINALRSNASLPTYSKAQLVAALKSKIDEEG